MNETNKEKLTRELLLLGASSRLKGAPKFHFWEIGPGKRESHLGLDKALMSFHSRQLAGETLNESEKAMYKALRTAYFDPKVNAYTHEMMNEDEANSSKRLLYVRYIYDNENFVLDDPEETTKQIKDHFHPILWDDLALLSDWELMREVIPPMQTARVKLEVYENQRWLYDERAQQAAETLAWRIENQYPDKQLPKKMNTTLEQFRIFEGYSERLERGTDARRWLITTLNHLLKGKGAERPNRRRADKIDPLDPKLVR